MIWPPAEVSDLTYARKLSTVLLPMFGAALRGFLEFLRGRLLPRWQRLLRWLGGKCGRAAAALKAKGVRPRVCIWSDALQTDILAVTHALVKSGQAEVLVVAVGLPVFLKQPIQRFLPLKCQLLDRDDWRTAFRVCNYAADVVVIERDWPDQVIAPRAVCMWHGLGMWKVKPHGEVTKFVLEAERHVGRLSDATNRLLAHCYGPTSREWWIREWGIPAKCCREMGMPYSDWILAPPYSREVARDLLQLSGTTGPTVLMALTWHYGDNFGGWGGLRKITESVLAWTRRHRGQLILCTHDRGLFDEQAITPLEQLAAEAADVCFYPRDLYPDNLPPLLAADIMVSNYSSLLGYFYLTGRPSIHLDPRGSSATMPKVASYVSGYRRLHTVTAGDARLHSFDEKGGVVVRDFEQLDAALDLALRDPGCCRERSQEFLARNVAGLDGNSSWRMAHEILDWMRNPI